MEMGYPPPEQTQTCENITSTRTTYADGNNVIFAKKYHESSLVLNEKKTIN